MSDDPRTARPQPPFTGDQTQPAPGLTAKMSPAPDHGEESYAGCGLLEGRAAIVTGGDSGIGRAVAIAFAREGADVAISFLPEERPDAEETARWIERAGRRAILLPGDLASEAWCAEVVARTVAAFGKIDVLVNNAATQPQNDGLEDVSADDLERAFRINVFAMFHLAKAALPHMKPGSSIINTTSEQAKVAEKSMLIYAATKGAISTLTVGLSNLLAPHGIRVNAVAPGPIWTPLQPSTKAPEELENLGKATPLGRAGQPAELAAAYVLLASDRGAYMTAAVVPVTGGVSIG